jgi:tetraacyldisaccharide 4'-kinase
MNFIKPKFWDLKKPNFISKLLIIFTLPFIINNFLLNIRSKKKNHQIKTICVGNIYLGGTGKTPSTIKLYKIFKKLGLKVAVGKKFYNSQLDEISLLKNETSLITDTNRNNIIDKTLAEKKNLLIFDDGLQDKGISYDVKIVCFDLNLFIGNGQLIPAGPLREKLDSIKKYDIVFLKGNNNNFENINQLLIKQNPNIKIFKTFYKPVNLKEFDIKKNYLLFSGIGNPNSFKDILLENNFNVIDNIIFPDHFEYNEKDIQKIKNRARKLNAQIVTTEKDFVKIKENYRNNINFLKIDLEIDREENFVNFINSKIND